MGAKVVTNARTPGARCYGYVTMASSEEAARSQKHLHLTELHGRIISVEKVVLKLLHDSNFLIKVLFPLFRFIMYFM